MFVKTISSKPYIFQIWTHKVWNDFYTWASVILDKWLGIKSLNSIFPVVVGKDQGDLWEQKGWQLCAETLGQHLRRHDCETGTPPPGLSGPWIGGRWGPGGAGPGSGLDWCLDWISAGWRPFQMSSCWVWRRDAVFLEVRGQGRQRLAENYEDWGCFLPLQERACY